MAKDPYRYFRIEARELVDALAAAALAFERGETPADGIADMMRVAHTLKGGARVVRLPEIAEIAHHIEDELVAHGASGAIPAPIARAIAAEIARIDALLRDIDNPSQQPAHNHAPTHTPVPAPAAGPGPAPVPAPGPAPTPAPPTHAADPFDAIRVERTRLDGLLAAILETSTRLGAVRRAAGDVNDARNAARALARELSDDHRLRGHADALAAHLDRASQDLGATVQRVDRDLGTSRDAAAGLRLVRVNAIFPQLERSAYDAAHQLGVKVQFESGGGDVRIDPHVLTAARDALVHLVRNTVAHAIEPQALREAAGKPPITTVRVDVQRAGRRVVFTCSDDGSGIDLAAVRVAAVRRGVIHERADDAAVLESLWKSGVSTATVVNEVAGRGVGLDAVRELVARCNGEVQLHTEAGRGTTFEIRVPVSAASLQAMAVRVDGRIVHVPLDAVHQAVRYASADIATTGDGERVLRRGAAVPYADLGALLGSGAADHGAFRSALVVHSGGAVAAIGVDRVIGPSEVVARPLPPALGDVPLVAGIALDADGNPELVLDRDALVAAARAAVPHNAADVGGARLPILVCDDSLTTRMLEQSILELAGYDVELATSGEQALALARSKRFALYVCDVEMPGMNGFQFVAATRADPDLRSVPAILVTSLSRPEDKKRGLDAGARAFIVKGEFDQGVFLDTVRGLVS